VIHLGLIGHPVAHSRSPDVHRAFGLQSGVAVEYDLFDVEPEALTDQVVALRAEGHRGLNITLPHKLEAARVATVLSDRAQRVGAVNTLRLSDLYGDNTDGDGLLRDLEDNLRFEVTGRRVLVLGASGAALSACAALLSREPQDLVVANRDEARARHLAEAVDGVTLGAYAALELQGFDLILNATSASLSAALPPLPPGAFTGVAYDLVSQRGPTVFQDWAMRAGAIWAADGHGMLVEQAALSWDVWELPRPDPKPLLEPGRVLRR
jgi:shikimate dehydrogenase